MIILPFSNTEAAAIPHKRASTGKFGNDQSWLLQTSDAPFVAVFRTRSIHNLKQSADQRMFSASRVLFHGGKAAAAAAFTRVGVVVTYNFGSSTPSFSEMMAPFTTTVSCAAVHDNKDQQIVIVGGGTAGIGVAAMCATEGLGQGQGGQVTVIEPKTLHYYQPLWTLVGAGIKSSKDSVRNLKDILPKSTNWVQNSVKNLDPEHNRVILQDGTSVEYDYLIVAAGMTSNFDAVPGVKEGLEKPESGVVSIYDFNYSSKVWNEFNRLKDAPNKTMLFTMPPTPIKCTGAPQKIMWLLEDTLQKAGLRATASIEFWVPGASMFGVPYYSKKLEAIRQERGVAAHFKQELVAIDVDKKEETFKDLNGSGSKHTLITKAYDFIHVVPHMGPPNFIKESKLANAGGWLEVDQYTLQSPKYKNVFALGDCTNTPNSKTAAAITSQAPVVVHNLEQAMEGKALDGKYNGYASCPLIIARKQCMLAEFGYGGKIMETFGHETGDFPLNWVGTDGVLQHRFFYFLKEQIFPFVYWNLWTRGYWYGTKGPFKPNVVPKNE